MIVNEMAMSKKDYIDMLKGYNNVFMTHIYLLAIYGNSLTSTNHWITELTNWCMNLDNISLKTKSRRPTTNDIYTYLLTNLETVNDAVAIIGSKSHDGTQLEISKESARTFINKWKRIRVSLADAFASGTIHSRKYYQDLLKQLL